MSLLICQPKNGNELATQEIHADPEFYIFCNASSFFEVNKCDDNWAKCRSSFAYRKNMATTRQRRRNHSVSEFDISFDARRTSVERASNQRRREWNRPRRPSFVSVSIVGGARYFSGPSIGIRNQAKGKKKKGKKKNKQDKQSESRGDCVGCQRGGDERESKWKCPISSSPGPSIVRNPKKKENKIKERRRPIGPFRRGDWSELAPAEERPVIIDVFIDWFDAIIPGNARRSQ